MAKSKRSKHMRAMRKILRDKLAKKDEVKRLTSLKNDNLIPSTTPLKSPASVLAGEEMQVGGNGTANDYNARTLKDKQGQYPSWLSGRQRKRLQIKEAVTKKHEKQKKKTKTTTGKVVKRSVKQTKKMLAAAAASKPDAMAT